MSGGYSWMFWVVVLAIYGSYVCFRNLCKHVSEVLLQRDVRYHTDMFGRRPGYLRHEELRNN